MQKSFLAKPEILILRKKLQRFLLTVTLQELCTIGNNCLLILNALLMACLNIAIITFCSRHLQIYTLSTSVSKTTTSHSYSSCKIHIVQLPQLVPVERDFALSILVRTLGAHLRESQRACLLPPFLMNQRSYGCLFCHSDDKHRTKLIFNEKIREVELIYERQIYDLPRRLSTTL